jgi:hypothetical protein
MLDYTPSGKAAIDSCQEPVAAADIQSLGVVVDRGTAQRLEIELRNAGYFSGPTASGAVWHGENGCSDPATPCDLTRPSQFNTDHINEIFFYARKLIADGRRFVLDEAAFMAAVDEAPLFLRQANG